MNASFQLMRQNKVHQGQKQKPANKSESREQKAQHGVAVGNVTNGDGTNGRYDDQCRTDRDAGEKPLCIEQAFFGRIEYTAEDKFKFSQITFRLFRLVQQENATANLIGGITSGVHEGFDGSMFKAVVV